MSAEEEKKTVKVTIVNMFPMPAREPERFGEQDYVVIVRVGERKVVQVRIPAKELTLERIREEVMKELRKYSEFIGKTFEIPLE